MGFKYLTDENLNGRLTRAILRASPGIDLMRVQDVGLREASDPEILAWAAQEGRILLTHDISTVTAYAYERVVAGLPMPGVIEIDPYAPFQQVIEDLLILDECSDEKEWENQVFYLPL